jgi:D-xylonolactonase
LKANGDLQDCIQSRQLLHLGEGPLWHPVWQELLVVDVPRGEIHRFDATLRRLGTMPTGRPTSALTWQPDGSILCFHDRGEISRIPGRDAGPEPFLAVQEESRGMFNDVIADPQGRVLCGALPIGNRPGRLYVIHRDGRHEILLDDLLEPNGLGFSADGRTMYFADSAGQTIWRFRYDSGAARLAERTAFWRTSGEELPDGLTIDNGGRIVCAIWGGGRVVRIRPDGGVDGCWRVPARRTTSVTFGGASLDALFVTSARQEGPEGADDESAGAVFRLAVPSTGRAEWPSRIAP